MEWNDFLHTGARSGKLKVVLVIFGWAWLKWAWQISSWDPNICCILRMSLWIEQIFCMLTVIQFFWLDCHWTLYLWLLSFILLQLYLLDLQQYPQESYQIESLRPSVLLFVGCFLGIKSLGFSAVWHGVRNLYQVVRGIVRIFGKTFLPLKLGKCTKNRLKMGFCEFKEKFDYWFSLNLFCNENL